MIVDVDFREFKLAEGVTVEVKPLEVWSYQSAMRVLQKAQEKASDSPDSDAPVSSGERFMTLLLNPETITEAKKIIPQHARALRGLQLRDGGKTREANVEDLTAHGSLFPMALNLLAHLISISMITEAEAGN